MNNLVIQAVSTLKSQGDCPCQEDSVLAEKDKGVFIVADGFGGPSIGEKAAITSCQSILNYLYKNSGDSEITLPFALRSYLTLAGNVLFNAFIYANRELKSLNSGKSANDCGGASISAAFLDGDLLAVANVGSCSVQLLRGGNLISLTVPRVFGKIQNPFLKDFKSIFSVPMVAAGVNFDLEPDVFEYKVIAGDWVLLHTDGLFFDTISHFLKIQIQNLTPEESLKKISEIFKQTKFYDNVALSLVVL